LTASHVSKDEDRTGLGSLNVFRWRDEAGVEGQDTTARLINYLSGHPGMLAIEVDGELVPIDLGPDGRTLKTRGTEPEADPLLGVLGLDVGSRRMILT